LPERNYRKFCAKREAIRLELERLNQNRHGTHTLAQLLRRPEMTYAELPGKDATLPEEVVQQVEIALKYEGYIERQEVEVEKFKTLEEKQIPGWLDYDTIPNLRPESRQKLKKIQPVTLGQASRIAGVNPSDISILMVWMKRGPGGKVQ
jgi:tRNA uridine 5-carboxymethylaminomethyl modification enzyme